MSTEANVAAQTNTNAAPEVNAQPVTPQVQATPPVAAASEVKTAQPTTEVKPEASATVVPEKYELKLAEGSLLDKSRVSEIEAYAKDNKLTNQQAQDLLNKEHEVVSKFHNQQLSQLEVMKEQWKQAVISDKELGGENFNRNIEYAHRALNQYGSQQLKDQLDKTGLGNHPDLVRMLANIGKAMAEDRLIKPGAMPANKKPLEEVFYGGTNKTN
jgi:hypothetical protein